MPDAVSSARPARLVLYGRLCHAVADGLVERAGRAEVALDEYLARNEPTFRFDCDEAIAAVHEVAGVVRTLGSWVGEVGIGFVAAGAWRLFEGHGHDPLEATDVDVAAAIETELAELRPAPRRAGTWTPDRDDPAWWGSIEDLGNAATATSVYTGLLDLPRVSNAAGAVSSALGGAGAVLDEWHESAALPMDDRVGNTVLHGGLELIGTVGGNGVGTTLCGSTAVLAPVAPACGAAGSMLGSFAMRHVAELFDRDPKPGEHDFGAVEDEIGDYDDEAVGDALDALDALDERDTAPGPEVGPGAVRP